MAHDYQRCLDELAAAMPERKSALIRSLLPGIEAALDAGQCLKAIWEALQKEGLQISYRVFHMTVSRARKMRKQTAPRSGGKTTKTSELQGLGRVGVQAVQERDPLANLKRLEENRPGFHWRGTRDLKTMVHGPEVSSDKSKR